MKLFLKNQEKRDDWSKALEQFTQLKKWFNHCFSENSSHSSHVTLFDSIKNAAEVSEKHFGLPGWRRQDHGPQLVLQQHEVGGVHGGQVSPRGFSIESLFRGPYLPI